MQNSCHQHQNAPSPRSLPRLAEQLRRELVPRWRLSRRLPLESGILRARPLAPVVRRNPLVRLVWKVSRRLRHRSVDTRRQPPGGYLHSPPFAVHSGSRGRRRGSGRGGPESAPDLPGWGRGIGRRMAPKTPCCFGRPGYPDRSGQTTHQGLVANGGKDFPGWFQGGLFPADPGPGRRSRVGSCTPGWETPTNPSREFRPVLSHFVFLVSLGPANMLFEEPLQSFHYRSR